MKEKSKNLIKIRVLFEGPFYIGIFEKVINDKVYIAKVTFGKEPKDKELNAYLNENYYKLKWQISDETFKDIEIKNPKRKQREARKEMLKKTVGTKSQNAIKKQYEENKSLNKKKAKENKELLIELKYELRQKKRREKHKGH